MMMKHFPPCSQLLHPDEDKRLQTVTHMMPHPFFESLDWEETREKQTTPTFIPPVSTVPTCSHLPCLCCMCVSYSAVKKAVHVLVISLPVWVYITNEVFIAWVS